MVMTNTIIFSVQTKTHAKSALIDQSIFFRATTRTTLPFMATPGGAKDATVTGTLIVAVGVGLGAKDATVTGTLEVAVGVGGEVIEVKSTLRGLKPGSGQAMWSTASLSLRMAVMSVCSVAFPSRG